MDRSGPPSTRSDRPTVDRRTVLAAGASLGATALAGCSQIADFLAGFVLEDVNVINATERRLTGTIQVTDPDGETVLDETFDLQAAQTTTETQDGGDGGDGGGDQPSEEASGLYGDVFTGEGEYEVVVEMAADAEFDVDGTEETVEVSNPGDEHIFVFFAAENGQDEILVQVADGLSDLENIEGS